MLLVARRSATNARTQAANQVHALVGVSTRPGTYSPYLSPLISDEPL